MQALKKELGCGRGLGRGLLTTDPYTQEMLGSNALSNNPEYSNMPTMSGSRSLGDAQPSSEKLDFEPIVKIQDAIENIQEILVPASKRNPGASDNMIFRSLAQQAAAYMDVKTFEAEWDMQLFKGDNVIVPADEGDKLHHISFINNIAASVVKHFSILAEMKGDLRGQGFIYEKPGMLDDCSVTVPTRGGANTSRNAKALYFYKAKEKITITLLQIVIPA